MTTQDLGSLGQSQLEVLHFALTVNQLCKVFKKKLLQLLEVVEVSPPPPPGVCSDQCLMVMYNALHSLATRGCDSVLRAQPHKSAASDRGQDREQSREWGKGQLPEPPPDASIARVPRCPNAAQLPATAATHLRSQSREIDTVLK